MILRIDKPEVMVGLTLENAQSYATEHGYESVVVSRENTMHTTPEGGYDPLRVKLSIVKNVVTKAEIG